MILLSDKKSKLIILTCFLVFLCGLATLHSFVQAQWNIIDFTEHGTRRLVVVEDNRWFFYRSEPNQELVLDVEGGKVLIKSAVRQDISELQLQIRINNSFRNFTQSKIGTSGDFTLMEDIYLNLAPGTHTLRIATDNRLAYFKVFREEEVWTVPTVTKAFTPDSYYQEYELKTHDSSNPYFSAIETNHLEFDVTGPNEVYGFARAIFPDDIEEAEFDVYLNHQHIETFTIPVRRTGTYYLAEKPDAPLSIGRRFEFDIPAGEDRVRIAPKSEKELIFRVFMDFPEVTPKQIDEIYGIDTFQEPNLFQRMTKGLQMTLGTSIRYNDNVFSLSEYDIDRFEDAHPIFSFIDTRDDLIINPSLRMRYSISLGKVTTTPYLNANYYQYLNNTDKTNYSVLTGLFNEYNGFNLNLYYGYYGDLYVRDYRDTDGTGEYEKYSYERNLYRFFSFFNLTSNDRPLLYFQIEEYFYNKHFTEYDGTATTYGLGWRRNFPTFYLRLFYYFRSYDPSNVEYNIEEIDSEDRITDFQYESNIYDVQFRNKRYGLINDIDFRPYFGFRFEDRFFTTKLPVDAAPFQSTRHEKRYRITLGSEFYLTNNLTLILDYRHFMRNVSSDNDTVPRLKDYSQNQFRLDFEYTLNF